MPSDVAYTSSEDTFCFVFGLFFFWVVSFAFTKVIKDIHLFVDIRINAGTKIPTVSDSPCLPKKLALRAVVGLEKY